MFRTLAALAAIVLGGASLMPDDRSHVGAVVVAIGVEGRPFPAEQAVLPVGYAGRGYGYGRPGTPCGGRRICSSAAVEPTATPHRRLQ